MSVISKLADAISPNGPSNAATIGRDGLIRPSIYDRHHFRTLGAAVAIVVAIPLFVSGIYGMGVATSCGLFAILSLGFYYQFALSGQFSFATSGFYGIGAFTSIWASKDFGFVGGILAAVVVCAIIGAFLKVLLARSPLIQFGIATLSSTP